MTKYVTNPNRRCVHCKGREVITMNGKNMTSSIKITNGVLECVNKAECKQNIEAESAMISFDPDMLSVEIEAEGLKMSVEYSSDMAKEVSVNDGR